MHMGGEKTAAKRGRPRGRQFDRVLQIRLPGPALKAIRELAKREHVTVAEAVRAGVMASMGNAVGPLIERIRNAQGSTRRRISAMKLLRLYMEADLHMGPMGLRIARDRANKKPNSSY